MSTEINEFLDEQKEGLVQLAANLRRTRVAAARRAAMESAARIRALNVRVRTLARSGLRLTAVSHGAVQNLIELQGEIVTSALNDAAEKIHRMAYTESVRDLARVQAEVLQAARQRIVEDIARSVKILKGAAGDVRRVAAQRQAVAAAAPKKSARHKVKSAAKAGAPRKARPATRAKRPVRKKTRGGRTANR